MWDLEIFCARCSKRKSRKRHALEMQSCTLRHEKSSYISVATGGGERMSWARAALVWASLAAAAARRPFNNARPGDAAVPAAAGRGRARSAGRQRPQPREQRRQRGTRGDTETSRARPTPDTRARRFTAGYSRRKLSGEARWWTPRARAHNCPCIRPCWTQDSQGRDPQSCQRQLSRRQIQLPPI